jgi:hypothetical protein
MTRDPSSELEARWFKKMNQSTSGTYRLAHAVRQNGAESFRPAAILEHVTRTAATHLASHIAAVSKLTARSVEPVHGRAARKSK